MYKVEIKTNDSIKRMPDIREVKRAIDEYCVGFNGVVIHHNSYYDYNYDTSLKDYHVVDSNNIIGQVVSTVIEDGKLFGIMDLTDDFNSDRNYICFYRANMQSQDSSRFEITNLFAVDLIEIKQNDGIDVDKCSLVIEC